MRSTQIMNAKTFYLSSSYLVMRAPQLATNIPLAANHIILTFSLLSLQALPNLLQLPPLPLVLIEIRLIHPLLQGLPDAGLPLIVDDAIPSRVPPPAADN